MRVEIHRLVASISWPPLFARWMFSFRCSQVGDRFGILAGQMARERMDGFGHEFDLVNRVVKLEEKLAKLHPAA